MKAKLSELNQKWESLKSKASQRRQDLEDSLQAQQYFADANEAESWMREKEPIVGSTDYGKDEDSAEVSERQEPAGARGGALLGSARVRRVWPLCCRCSGQFRTCLLSTVETQPGHERAETTSYLERLSLLVPLFSPHARAHMSMSPCFAFLSQTLTSCSRRAGGTLMTS